MVPSPPLVALSKTAAAATRRAATAAASVAAHGLLLPARSLSPSPSLPSSLIPRRRLSHMSQEEDRASRAPLPLQGRSSAVAVGPGGVIGEVPALAVVSFYRFADFPGHAAFRRPLKELCEELVNAQRSHWRRDIVACDVLNAQIEISGNVEISEAKLLKGDATNS